MKRLIPILLLALTILIPSSAGSWGPVMMSGGVAASAPALTYIYAGDGTWETTGAERTNSDAIGGWTGEISGNHNITEIGCYVDNVGTTTEIKICLYTDLNVPMVYGVISSPAVGWNNCTVASTAVTNASRYKIMWQPNGNCESRCDSGSTGKYLTKTYADAWPSTSLSDDGSSNWATRMGY